MQPTQSRPSQESSVESYLGQIDALLAYGDSLFEQTKKISDLKCEKKVIAERAVKLDAEINSSAQKLEQIRETRATLESKLTERKQEIEALDAEQQAIALKKQALLAALAKKKAQQQGSNSSVTSTQ